MNFKIPLAILLLTISAAAQTNKPSRRMVVTFDDLPYVDIEQRSLPKAQRATEKILRALRAQGVPVVAFVNEGNLQVVGEVDARIALLQQWVDAGMTLGNHTYSHPDFNKLTIEQFQDEIIKGEVVTRRLMQRHPSYQLYFRHPYTHTGDTQAKKEAIENFLTARGYKITPHTIDGQDYVFNGCYLRALRKGDQATAKRLREAYLEFTVAATEFAERISLPIFGREIPQTLLVHANDINADSFDELLKRLAAREYRFVSLDEAMSDPAYQTKDTYVTKFGPSWLWRWTNSKGMKVRFQDDPEPPQWVTELCSQKLQKETLRSDRSGRVAVRRTAEDGNKVTQHIGIVAGSAEGAALCYRTICLEAPAFMGEHNHPEITMNSVPMAEHMPLIRANDWEAVAKLLAASAHKVAKAGADFAICPDNTYHQSFKYLIPQSPIPWLHIAGAVGAEAHRLGFTRLGILGTKYLMEGGVYPEALKEFNIEREIPDEVDRERINEIIFKELVNGIFPETSRLYFNEVTDKLKARGCDAVVLGCTEIPLIVRPDDSPLPTLDSTRLLARAALRKALE